MKGVLLRYMVLYPGYIFIRIMIQLGLWTRVPKSEVEALRKALPMCQIDF